MMAHHPRVPFVGLLRCPVNERLYQTWGLHPTHASREPLQLAISKQGHLASIVSKDLGCASEGAGLRSLLSGARTQRSESAAMTGLQTAIRSGLADRHSIQYPPTTDGVP